MKSNKPIRDKPWRIGSFTKNFSWGKPDKGFERLHLALNAGFGGELKPVPRQVFWERLEKEGFIPHVVCNFFVYNGIIQGESFIFPDELAFQALSRAHGRSFDKLTFFSLLLSEVGKWKGARAGQSQPSEWARYFILKELQRDQSWNSAQFSPDMIERFLSNNDNFEGETGTRKLATNLAYFFSLANLPKFTEEDNGWIADAIFLALDRYFMKSKPAEIGIEWAINTLSENDVANLAGPFENEFVEFEGITARLFVESKGVDRLSDSALETICGVISRQPLLYKELPATVEKWLKNRIFVELVSKERLESLEKFDADAFYDKAIEKLHNTLPRPSLSGDQLLALVRPQDDSD